MIAGVVLTYHPTAEVVENVLEILKQVDRVYLVNNEYTSATEVVLSELSKIPNVKFINFDQNQGVAAGFNSGMTRAFEEGYQYCLLFDQDSVPAPEMVTRLLSAYEAQDDVGIVGPKLKDQKAGRFFDAEEGVKPRDLLISSGSLISSQLVSEIGYLDESFFIDYVDHDYCLRAKALGKVNYIVNDAVLVHQFGEPEERNFFGRRVTVSNYAPIRHYYMARNRIFLVRKYGAGAWFWEDLGHFFKMWVKVILFEGEKGRKLLSCLRGCLDGLLASSEFILAKSKKRS